MALDEITAPEAVARWLGELLGIPTDRQFLRPLAVYHPMPNLAAVVARSRNQEGPDDSDFPYAGLQQVNLAVFPVEVSVMVERAENADVADQRSAQIRTYAKKLRERLPVDADLGGRVQMASPRAEIDFEWNAELEDGTLGHAIFATISVAERIDEPL